ncbi:MAG TPA: hypothetical protein VK471_11790 [Solirubrobacterales bacterium]|nr:hypothetical protein [Solirubrobacterales bacterium]
MGILDDAIKEHLELKRQHGAADDELKQLEDEVFGAAERPGDEESAPDPLAEAPTEFMSQPDLEPETAAETAPRQAAPEVEEEEEPGRRLGRSEIADLQEAPPSKPEERAPEPEAPAEEEAPAMEHEAVPELPSEPEISTGPTTEEREAIAEQPTEMYDIEEELASSQAEAPSEEELVEEEMEEPRLAPVDPLAGIDDDAAEPIVEKDEEDDDFWDEKRLSDELDQALEAPVEVEEEEEDAVFEPEPAPEAEPEAEEKPAGPDEDVLEETPDFLEEAPEDDQLWFEQKPPKDFDFDD